MEAEQLSKKMAGEKAAQFIEQDMTIGLGTGSTVYWAIERLGQRVKEGLRIQAIATSLATEQLAKEFDIPLTTFKEVKALDLTIDGADEISSQLDMIKGGGGALLREKLVAISSRKRIIVVDFGKRVEALGRFALPIEVVPFGWERTVDRISPLGCKITLRKSGDVPFITDNGNYILDCKFEDIMDPMRLHNQIKLLPGVIETGLFVQLADLVVVGYPDRTELVHQSK